MPGRLRALAAGVAGAFATLLDWVYPRQCYCCGAPLTGRSGRLLCRECFRHLASRRLTGRGCATCGLPLSGGPADVCGYCQQYPRRFDLARAVCPYGSPMGDLVRSFKFDGAYFIGPVVIDSVAKLGWLPPEICEADAVAPVPLHPRRRRERGYDQALILARALARRGRWKLLPDALRRVRYTDSQKHLSPPERAQNVRGAFEAGSTSVEGLHVLLVDDVVTTGATASECAGVLKKAGAARVSVFSLARTTP